MAVIRNLTRMDIRLPNMIVVPALGEITCDSGDIVSASVFPMVIILTADGQMSYDLGLAALEEPTPEPVPEPIAEPGIAPAVPAPPADTAEATFTPLPPTAGKASKG